MDRMITILCAVIGSGAAAAVVQGIFARRADEKRLETGESQGMRWLLQDRLEQQAKAFLDADYISYDNYKNWNKGHHIYHDLLGGNGDLSTLKDQLKSLYLRGEAHEQ